MAYEFGTCDAPEIEGLSGVCDSASTEQRGTVVDLEDCDGKIIEMRLHALKKTTRVTMISDSPAPTLTPAQGTSILTSVTERWSRGAYKVIEAEKQEIIGTP